MGHINSQQLECVALLHTLYRCRIIAQIADQGDFRLGEGSACSNPKRPDFDFTGDFSRATRHNAIAARALKDRLIICNKPGDKA